MVDGQLHYESKTGEFFLLEPEVRKLNVAGVPQQYQDQIRSVVEVVAKQTLSRIPVYELRDDDPEQSLAKTFLKSVDVHDGKLILELGLF